MTRRSLSVVAVFVAACGGVDEAVFIEDYNTAWCDHVIKCSDPAELRFEGTSGIDDCKEDNLPGLSRWGKGCLYDGVQADLCLEDMLLLTCPAQEGRLADEPATCAGVYLDCKDSGDSGDPVDTGDAGDSGDSGDSGSSSE